MKRSIQLVLVAAAALVLSAATANAASIAVNNAAAMNGTNFGMEVTLNDTAPAYVLDSTPNAETTYRGSFWLDPNTWDTQGIRNSHVIFSGNGQGGVAVLRVYMLFNPAGATARRVRIWCKEDNGVFAKSTNITLGPIGAEPPRKLDFEMITGPGTGSCTLTRSGGSAPSVSLTNLDNDTWDIRTGRLGAITSVDAVSSGSYYLDEFESFR
jgi:hypothetical protein